MKYCPKCGSSMEDDMLFCQKCGTRIPDIDDSDSVSAHTEESNQTQYEPESYDAGVNSQPSERKGMKKLLIACLLLAGMTVLVGGSKGDFGMVLGMGGFFAVLAVMFFVLAKSPQDNPYILNKASGLKKTVFVLISVILAFVLVGVGEDMSGNLTTKDSAISNNSQSESENVEVTTLSDVQKWYEDQIPAVSQSLMDYAKSVDGLTYLNVNSSKFRFGEDQNFGVCDCHYTFNFTCNINGTSYNGEARAFMKYQDSAVNWFHFEIFSNSGTQSLVEHYDDSYDQIIEDYYNELKTQYKE